MKNVLIFEIKGGANVLRFQYWEYADPYSCIILFFVYTIQYSKPILCCTILTRSIQSGEYLSYIPRGVGAFGLRLSGRTQCVLLLKRKPNTHTPPTIWDKNSPNYVSCRIGFSTLYPSSRGQTCQLQD